MGECLELPVFTLIRPGDMGYIETLHYRAAGASQHVRMEDLLWLPSFGIFPHRLS